jgi:hypothetical protein
MRQRPEKFDFVVNMKPGWRYRLAYSLAGNDLR